MAVKLNCGTFDKDTKQAEIPLNNILELLWNMCGDSTIMQGWGVYTHEDGKRIVEPTFEITCYDKSMAEGRELAEKLCHELNQAEIVVTELVETKTEFIKY